LACKIVRQANEGSVALVDRWPTDEVGKMDGPRIRFNCKSSVAIRAMGGIEEWAYSRMPKADVCFYFEVPLSVAITRNQSRVKQGKETDEEINSRFENNKNYKPLARRLVRFNNEGELIKKKKEFLMELWKEVARC